MNGIDAVAIAAGQDWRAIEAGAHAFACSGGQYRPLSEWTVEGSNLIGRIELPLALGTVGGPTRIHPGVQLSFKLLRVSNAKEMEMVFAAAGLAQNFPALPALCRGGVQQGPIAPHPPCLPLTSRRHV